MVKATEALHALKGFSSPQKIKPNLNSPPISPGGVQKGLQKFSLTEDQFTPGPSSPAAIKKGLNSTSSALKSPLKSPNAAGVQKKQSQKKKYSKASLAFWYESSGRVIDQAKADASQCLLGKPQITFTEENLQPSDHALKRMAERDFTMQEVLSVVNHAPIYRIIKPGENRVIQYGRFGSTQAAGDLAVVRPDPNSHNLITVIRKENTIPPGYSYWLD